MAEWILDILYACRWGFAIRAETDSEVRIPQMQEAADAE